MSKFHIRIEDLEKGESLLDTDTDCIVGAVDLGDEPHVLSITCCDPPTLAATVHGVEVVVRRLKKEHPIIEGMLAMYALLKAGKQPGLDDQTSPDDEPENN